MFVYSNVCFFKTFDYARMNSPANSVGLFEQAAKMIRHASESASFVHEGDYIFLYI